MSYIIYKLLPNDFDRYKTHLKNLDSNSKYMRFGFHVSDYVIDELVNKWSDKFDQHHIFVIENNELEILAVAHISLEETPIELSFSVLSEYQRKGMGDALMTRAIEWCQNRNIKHGYMVCLSTNTKVKNLAKKHGILVKSEDGESYGEVEIPNPTPLTYWKEYIETNLAALDHINKTQIKFNQMFKFPLLF